MPVYCLHKRKLHLLHLHFDLFKTIFAFLKVSLNILCVKKFFPNIKQVNYTCSKNTGEQFFMESSRGLLEAQGGAGVQRSPGPRHPGLGTGGSPGQTLPVALKHKEQPHGGGVTVMTAPDRLWPAQLCLVVAMGTTSGLAG